MPLILSSKSRKANSAHARKQMPFNYLVRHRLFHVVWCPGRLKLDGENYSVSSLSISHIVVTLTRLFRQIFNYMYSFNLT